MSSHGTPRSLVAAIAGITVVPLGVLLWLGWRLLDQDRILEGQQAQERLERAADLTAAALERAVAATEQRLAVRDAWAKGAVVVTFGEGRADAYPPDRLAYLPAAPVLREAPAAAFAAGEELEFRRHDRTAAMRAYGALAKSADPAVRAGALLRLARNLKMSGQVEEALAAYGELSRMDDVAVGSTPAGLVGCYARCQIFAELRRERELRREAAALATGLREARWPLSGPVYALYTRDAAKWTGGAPDGHLQSEIFANAAEELWKRRPQLAPAGRQALAAGGAALTAIWRTEAGRLRILLATPEFVESQWLSTARQPAMLLTLSPGPAGGTRRAVRGAGETGLPWPIAVSAANPAAPDAAFALRRRLLMAGFALLVSMALIAGYVIFRAVGRELAAARVQSEFVSAVSHEFRTPLTALRQFTDMLREHGGLAEERRRLCYEAQARATERLTRLVESLLDFGRMEAGAQTYRRERRDCRELVAQTVEEFRGDPEAAGYEIGFRGSAAEAEVDPDLLARAVRNLLDNAVKYSPERRPIAVGVERRNGSVRIAVQDRGIGVPAHEQTAIFARFRRGEQAAILGIKGTGIGLAMVDQIAKAHGGRIELDSRPGEGSTFTIVLPAKEPQWRES